MTVRQKKAVLAISLFLIFGCVSLLVWTTTEAVNRSLTGEHWPGRAMLGLMDNSSSFALASKAVPFIILVGVQFLARGRLPDWLFYSMVACCLIGLLCCLILLLLLLDRDVAGPLWSNSPFREILTYDSLKFHAVAMLSAMAIWLGSLLIIQLGIKGSDN